MYRHMIRAHLPWFFWPHVFGACWQCHLVEPKLQYLEKHFYESHAGISRADLQFGVKLQSMWNNLILVMILRIKHILGLRSDADFVSWFGQYPCLFESVIVTDRDQFIMTIFHGGNTARVPPLGPVRAFDMSLICHWRFMSNLLTVLPIELSMEIMDGGAVVELTPEKISPICKVDLPSEIPIFVDGHFHLEKVNVPELLDNLAEVAPWKMEMAVASFCWPSSWPLRSAKRESLRQTLPVVRYNFGIHPKVVWGIQPAKLQKLLQDLDFLLDSRGTVGLGECGLRVLGIYPGT